ncbi:bifunctional glutamate N-acetyltransferase/amino-acid acetyltransferase ArgJ [Rhodococcus sp. NPDC003382]|uniref:bifunctional glutamate N-acetyltransferase/amino-acid acetyltransferase ArgJ n=1 Tax=unclassified Rhodococcus (in: high G+C Gram-positive bacteria) TaxID=192944 RepID=UPI0018CCB8D0|nr:MULTISPECIES: bifunctional glutamate N-acetyltransferase/amino-acid acetyltransferase ArgJ [unclassified Rhodococcus (in: high G+C Gram-positive bacteria)]MBH0119760.1 bifunctional glutamate N-acetyltransferase/amino-acid acetyltransferase ArgJ [Rhodococcus sp. CX]MCK8672784.1 bifunctional glutamate N-acetyltransferase/amino-acid acetyltransferase ArgJ [Rhodococcus sp. HM1]
MIPAVDGFISLTGSIGVKDNRPDFALLGVTTPDVASAAVFTRSRFAGPSVRLDREVDLSALRGVVVVSGNANVATGEQGLADARTLRAWAADRLGCPAEQVLVASTGVIGVLYPMERMLAGMDALPAPGPADLGAVAEAIMTTDTRSKCAFRTVGNATVVGVAKGVGMMEPNMATMLSFIATDAQLAPDALDRIFRSVVDRTYNAVSVDSDTSTSDTAAVFASGAAGPVDPTEFEAALLEVCTELVRMIASDGEGASKLIEVRVTGARDDAQAKLVAKAVVNSPLVKTAVHGADPNWGRVAMAVGKCESETDILEENVRIAFGGLETYPVPASPERLAALQEYLGGDEVVIEVDLGIAAGEFTAYGCDLTEGYIRINADYTT